MSAKTSKIDLYKTHKQEYVAKRTPGLVKIRAANYLSISGQGKPGGPEFQACIGALYGAAYTIKMTRKFAGKEDYAVCKLEGQWWVDDCNDFSRVPQEQWRWKLMIRTPEFIGENDLSDAVAVSLKRGKEPEVKRVAIETLEEGTCVQMLHVGPYEKEAETIAVMKKFAEERNYVFHGRHHEIYLSDPRRVPSERLKTILREPVTAK